jgi:type IV secretory pathway TraG/TraD family ATPase VirD4
LAPLHRLQQLPDGQAVLVYQNLPPARIRLLPWYRDRRFRALRSRAAAADQNDDRKDNEKDDHKDDKEVPS